jgi:hypothetical protein
MNRFYSDESPPTEPWFLDDNVISQLGDAVTDEGWLDSDRTLARYVTEVLGLTLLDWGDDPYLDPDLRQIRIDAGEAYDPTGLKTFMAVATGMRKGGNDAIPSSGKPEWDGDYPWDERFTALSVVNWIREGFGLEAVR